MVLRACLGAGALALLLVAGGCSDDPEPKVEPTVTSSAPSPTETSSDEPEAWEVKPKAGLLPADAKARAHCRAICGEMHSGFATMRGALPMNIKAHFPNFKVWSRAQGDIDRVLAIWKECLATYGGPFLFGKQPCTQTGLGKGTVLATDNPGPSRGLGRTRQ